jgi:effector-binding domain-containing protein
MTYDIESRTLTEQPTAVVRASLPADQIGGWLPGVYQEVMTYLAGAGVAPAGPPFARYDFHDHTVDVEAGFPVSSPVPGYQRVTPSSLPGGPAAVTVHYGRYEDLTAAYSALAGWLKEHGRDADGPHWEVYYTDPQAEPDPTRWRTDLIVPYRSG